MKKNIPRTTKKKEYNHLTIEKKWQKEWDKKKIYEVKNTVKGKRFYGLIEFPYPSGAGLHVGHIRSNTAMDILTRKRRMEGCNVLFPIGWDAFGLPTENYAIKTGIQPEKVTKQNTDIFRKQLKSVGFGFDWSREINTTDPTYYKWTQWIFLQFFKRGLAYKATTTINWCPKDKIGLANEEVVDGKCERCGTQTVQKEKEQWILAITKYADRLDRDLDLVDFIEPVKIQQRNWIGRQVDEHGMVTYNLRDWIFSRQRYWGEPIPIIHCEKCGMVPVPEKELPVRLPKVKSYAPTDTGESPLSAISKWVEVKCPTCKGKAKRETDTMPNWAGSSWYFLRYADPKNKKEFASKKALDVWMKHGVNWYNGGMEHTTLHLLYSRFWHKFLYDLKLVPTPEPYMKRTSHGMILAEGGEKMSKSKGNTVNPDDIVKVYGADTLRVYEMFMGPFDQAVAWNTDSIIGARRFLEKVWKFGQLALSQNTKTDPLLDKMLHKTIQKVSLDVESMGFNTAISAMMVFVNEIEKNKKISIREYKKFLQLVALFAPHIAEELWHMLGEKKSIHLSSFPKYDARKVVDEEVTIAVQVNGKVRSEITVSRALDEESVKKQALADPKITSWIEGKEIRRIIYVPGRLVNIVV
jgi:leucyl-tRNA synthetase